MPKRKTDQKELGLGIVTSVKSKTLKKIENSHCYLCGTLIPLAPPVFTSRSQNKTVDEGKQVVLKCKASSRDTKIKWIKDGKTIPSLGPRHFILRGSLIFIKIFYEDKGFYTCEISNKAGVKTTTSYLKVRGSQKLGKHSDSFLFSTQNCL